MHRSRILTASDRFIFQRRIHCDIIVRMSRFAFSALRQGISCSVGPPGVLRKAKPLLHLNEHLCIATIRILATSVDHCKSERLYSVLSALMGHNDRLRKLFRAQHSLGDGAIFLNLKIGRKLVLLKTVFNVRSPCCCSYSSRSNTRDRPRPERTQGYRIHPSRFDNCSMTSRSIRSCFSAQRLTPLLRRGRS